MKKRFLRVLLVLSLGFAVFSIMVFRDTFPDIGLPVYRHSSEPAEPSANGSPYKFYYDGLTPPEKQAYNLIMDKIYDMPERIPIPYVNETELDNIFSALLFDNPDLFFLGRKCMVTDELWCHFFSVEYIIEKDEYETKKKELAENAEKIIGKLSDPSDKWQTEYEIHNWIVDHCSYKLVNKDYTYSSAYGCLVNRKCGCEGYSKAAKLLFDMVGIENALVSGKSHAKSGKEGPHMWNIVKINGNFYHLDITWDDPVNDRNRDMRTYSYFNVSDDEIKKNHSDFSINIPCLSMAENYYTKTGTYFSSYSRSKEGELLKMIIDSYLAGGEQAQFRFTNKNAYRNACDELINEKRFAEIMRKASESTNGKLTDTTCAYSKNDDLLTITIMF